MSDPTEFRYTPFNATPKAFLLFAGAVAVIGAFEVRAGGTLWPILPIQSNWHLIFWMFVILSPLVAMQLGLSYELTDDALVVRRFAGERARLALADYLGRDVVLGIPTLRFEGRTMRFLGGVDAGLGHFLAELDRRLLVRGAVPATSQMASTKGTDLTIKLAQIRFPATCVCCGGGATTRREIEAKRGFDVVVARFVRFVRLPVPTCREHARRHAIARWGAYVAIFVGTTALATVGLLISAPKMQSEVAPMLGLVLGALATRIAVAFNLPRHIDARVLGVSAVNLDAELTSVTLRVRDPELRRTLAASAGIEDVSRVFA